jgi:hypothetical protein
MGRQDDRMDRDVVLLDKNMAVLTNRFDTLEEKLDGVTRLLDCFPKTYATKEELAEAMGKFKPYTTVLNMVGGATLLSIVAGIIKLISTHQVL